MVKEKDINIVVSSKIGKEMTGEEIEQAVTEFKKIFRDKKFNGIKFLLKKAVIQLM